MTAWAPQRHRRSWTPNGDITAATRHAAAGNHAEAAALCRGVLERDPQNFVALHMLGAACLELSQFAEARDYLVRAARERPDAVEVHTQLGNALLRLEQAVEAEAAFRRALALAPQHFLGWNDLGVALSMQKRFDEAIGCFERVLFLRPNYPPALHNLGKCLFEFDRLEDAVDNLRAALAFGRHEMVGPWLINVHSDLCTALMELGRYDEAQAACQAMLELGFDPPSADWAASFILLKFGNYADGWRKYEARYTVEGQDAPHEKIRLLDLAEVPGKRILVCSEQGNGDNIQFARYASLLARQGARVCLSVYKDLRPLMQTLDGVESVITLDDAPPPHDLVTPLLSLPLTFRTVVETIPAAVPYLHPPTERLAAWQTRLGSRRQPRIGIFWWGAQHIPRRSMPVWTLAPILELPGFCFHALQKQIRDEDRQWLANHAAVQDHSEALADFADTAALIAQLDIVITIDTGVAHLAGALGRPVWIMLPFNADWRWLRDRSDSPWYPTALLFRQERRGDWHSVVARVAQALAQTPFDRG